jgi:hypothetical protein
MLSNKAKTRRDEHIGRVQITLRLPSTTAGCSCTQCLSVNMSASVQRMRKQTSVHIPLLASRPFLPPIVGTTPLTLVDRCPFPLRVLALTTSLLLPLSCFQRSAALGLLTGNMLYCRLYRLRL